MAPVLAMPHASSPPDIPPVAPLALLASLFTPLVPLVPLVPPEPLALRRAGSACA